MSEDSPKIVSLETSLELSEFPSEAEFTSEAGRARDPTPALAAPIDSCGPSARMSSNVVPTFDAEPRLDESEAPRPSAPVAAAASVTSIAAGIAREHVQRSR